MNYQQPAKLFVQDLIFPFTTELSSIKSMRIQRKPVPPPTLRFKVTPSDKRQTNWCLMEKVQNRQHSQKEQQQVKERPIFSLKYLQRTKRINNLHKPKLATTGQSESVKDLKVLSERQLKAAVLTQVNKTVSNITNQVHSLKKDKFLLPSFSKSTTQQISPIIQPTIKLKAEAFIVSDQNNNILLQQNSNQQLEIASLTKIMTLFCAVKVTQQIGIEPKQETITILNSSMVQGTSAGLRVGEVYSLLDLMYGLMLPSGNDASLSLGIWAGKKLSLKQNKQ